MCRASRAAAPAWRVSPGSKLMVCGPRHSLASHERSAASLLSKEATVRQVPGASQRRTTQGLGLRTAVAPWSADKDTIPLAADFILS